MKRALLLLTALLIGRPPVCAAPDSGAKPAFVRIAPDGRGFVADGKPFYPMGCNYFDPHVGWAPKLWQKFDAQRVEEHFRVMRGLGVNVVRVFLTAQSFFPEPPRLEPDALAKFDAMLAIARRHNIRVHPTGPDHWEGRPPWAAADMFADRAALDAQVAFWTAFAARYKDDPTLFAYDLRNEPEVRWNGRAMETEWRAWLQKRYPTLDALRKAWGDAAAKIDSFESVPVPPDEPSSRSAALLDYQRFRESLGDRWTKLQTDAIRAADPNHLVTVGLIQWTLPANVGKPSRYAAFRPSRIAPLVDFLSVHFYPLWGDPLASDENFDRNLAYLELLLRYVKAGDPRKPLFVGEFGWYGGGRSTARGPFRSAEDQARWCRAAALQGKGIAAGWLNWAYADTPAARDLTIFSGLVTEDGKPKPWGEAFARLAADHALWFAQDDAPAAAADFELDRAIVDPRAGDEMLRRYFEAWKPARRCGLRIR